jgi:hypothetical protein
MNSIYTVSRLISSIRNREKFHSRTSWVQWREIIEEVYREKHDKSKVKLIINSGVADNSQLKSNEDFIHSLSKFREDERQEIIELLFLYYELLNREKEYILSNKLQNIINASLEKTEIDSTDLISKKVNNWIDYKEEDKFYFKIKLKGTSRIILYDFVLRIFSLWILNFFMVNHSSENNEAKALTILIQFIMIPGIIIFYSQLRDKKIQKSISKIFKDLSQNDLKIMNTHSPWNYLIAFLLIITSIFFNLVTLKIEGRDTNIFLFLLILYYFIYYSVVLSFYSKNYLTTSEIIKQIEKINLNQVKNNLDHLDNDEEIIELDVNLRSANEKMDAYVLEAALLGALAFSGFLQLISSANIDKQNLNLFSFNFYKLSEGIVKLSSQNIIDAFTLILNKNGVLCLLSYLTLFCSVFFLAVIASRLRFNDLTDIIDKTLQMSKTYNEKEEQLISRNNGQPNQESNLITKKIRKQLIKGNLTLEQTTPIMEYMRFFRTLGILLFFIIIICSGLIISLKISIILTFIVFVSFMFFKLKLIRQKINNITTQFQEYYFKIENKVYYFILFALTLCFVLRSFSFDWVLSQVIIVISFLLIFIHYLFSLFIPEKLEDEEITQSIFLGVNRKKVVLKKIYKISLSLFFLGLLFKILHWPYANILLILGVVLISFHFIFGQKSKNNNFFLEFIFRSSFSITMFSSLFFIMHWPGSSILQLLSIFMLVLSSLTLLKRRKDIFENTKKITITFIFLTILLQFPFMRFALTSLSFNYPIYLKNLEISEIRTKITEPIDNGFLNAKSTVEIDSLLYYMKKNDQHIEFIGPHDLQEYCWIILTNQNDTSVLEHGLKWSNWIVLNDPYYQHYLLKLEYLIKLKHFYEAQVLIQKIQKTNFKEVDANFQNEISRIKNICSKKLNH